MIKGRRGFTLFETVLVVVTVGTLTGIVLLAIRPTSKLSDARNDARRIDTNSILHGVYQYALSNSMPNLASTSCDAATNEICKTGIATSTCTSSNLVNLSFLTTNGRYMHSLPIDPMGGLNANGTGYHIAKTASNKIVVCAPQAEDGATISASR